MPGNNGEAMIGYEELITWFLTKPDPITCGFSVQPKSNPTENHNECAGNINLEWVDVYTRIFDSNLSSKNLDKEVSRVSLQEEDNLEHREPTHGVTREIHLEAIGIWEQNLI